LPAEASKEGSKIIMGFLRKWSMQIETADGEDIVMIDNIARCIFPLAIRAKK
jgi:hypothetical protein